MDDRARWRGIHVILITPFREDLSLNLDGHRRNVRHAVNGGAHVLVLMGTQGEFHSLSFEERKALIQVTVEEVGGRLPVIVGASHVHTLEAVELSRFARAAGADAVMLTPPYFAQVSPTSVKDHVLRVAREADVNVFLYNAPERAGFNWTPEMLLDLVSADPRIVGVKQATPNVHELAETVALVDDKMAVIGGSEAMIYQTLALGMIGCTSTTASFLAGPFVEMYNLIRENRYVEARTLFLRLAPLRRAFKAVGHAAGVKIGMDLVGLAGGPVRPPLPLASAEGRALMARAFDEAGLKLPVVT
ncbi:MAG: dihydrodipicolinate synthase family protein [Chloroflexi bacterium]|nr:dihydrodipicolinate synthase family protein [Chloroflexota bacterium]